MFPFCFLFIFSSFFFPSICATTLTVLRIQIWIHSMRMAVLKNKIFRRVIEHDIKVNSRVLSARVVWIVCFVFFSISFFQCLSVCIVRYLVNMYRICFQQLLIRQNKTKSYLSFFPTKSTNTSYILLKKDFQEKKCQRTHNRYE